MGAKSSKPVAQAKYATRKFPSRPAGQSAVRPPRGATTPSAQQSGAGTGAASPAPRPREQQQQQQQASFTKDDAIKADGMDPQAFPSSGRSSNNNNADIDPNHHTNAAFSQRLRQMGVATPNPTLSNSSTVNSHGGFSRNNNNNSSNNASRFVQDPSLSRETPATTTKQQQQQQPSPTTVSTNKTSTSSLGSPRDSSRPLPTGRATTTSTQQQQGGRGGGGNSNSTTLNALQVRKELAERAQHEFERGGNVDREFLDVNTLRQILVLAERGGGGGGDVDAAQIEKRLNLKKGVVARLVGGKAKGVFGPLEV